MTTPESVSAEWRERGADPAADAAGPDVSAVRALGVVKRYRRRTACAGVNMLVRPGEIFGLLGPNGAGKSTFVKMVLGLVRPTEGSIFVFGRPVTDVHTRRRIGYLPELFRYQPWLTAQEVVDLHARLLGLPRAKRRLHTERVLCEVGLEARARDRVHGFSKGMQQRLGLAAALVGEPDLLVLDEPTSAMDPVGRHDVGELLRKQRAAGRTVFLNSHLLSDMEGVCDRVALLRKGRVIYTGSLREITRGGGRYRITVSRLAAATLEALAAAWPVETDGLADGTGHLLVTAARGELPRIHRLLQDGGADVFEVEAARQSLEEWFVTSLREGGKKRVDDRAADHS